MKSERTFIILTFLGMVGLYVAGYMLWQKYQSLQQTVEQNPIAKLFGI